MPNATTLNLPNVITAGDTVTFTVSFSDYPASTWACALYFNQGAGVAPTHVTGTASTGGNPNAFDFTLSGTFTAALAAVQYTAAFVATNGSQTATPAQFPVSILPSATATQALTTAQSMVLALQTVLAEFAATTKASVSFNGQSFSRASIMEYQKQLVYWQSQVIAETKKQNALRGIPDNSLVSTRFVPSPVSPGYGQFGWPYYGGRNI